MGRDLARGLKAALAPWSIPLRRVKPCRRALDEGGGKSPRDVMLIIAESARRSFVRFRTKPDERKLQNGASRTTTRSLHPSALTIGGAQGPSKGHASPARLLMHVEARSATTHRMETEFGRWPLRTTRSLACGSSQSACIKGDARKCASSGANSCLLADPSQYVRARCTPKKN
jgi:hypothetical protein